VILENLKVVRPRVVKSFQRETLNQCVWRLKVFSKTHPYGKHHCYLTVSVSCVCPSVMLNESSEITTLIQS